MQADHYDFQVKSQSILASWCWRYCSPSYKILLWWDPPKHPKYGCCLCCESCPFEIVHIFFYTSLSNPGHSIEFFCSEFLVPELAPANEFCVSTVAQPGVEMSVSYFKSKSIIQASFRVVREIPHTCTNSHTHFWTERVWKCTDALQSRQNFH